jgi:hypothetical protein
MTIAPSAGNPTLAESIGWDLSDAANDEMVTIVKREVIFSEVTIPKSEFLKVVNDEYKEYFREEIEPKMETDEVMEDYGREYTKYAVFEGDISSMTDDVVGMCDFEWEWYPNKVQPVEFSV